MNSDEKYKTPHQLKTELDCFFSANPEVVSFLEQLQSLGVVVILGGMLRDFILLGQAVFDSDIDLVIDTDNEDGLATLLHRYKPTHNKFGGYRLKISHWDIDIWNLRSTWAFKKGHLACESVADLCKSTFFDWDGIIYNTEDGTILTVDGYFDNINAGMLGINLDKNPNPMGNIDRALKYRDKYCAKFTDRLVTYIYENSDLDDINNTQN